MQSLRQFLAKPNLNSAKDYCDHIDMFRAILSQLVERVQSNDSLPQLTLDNILVDEKTGEILLPLEVSVPLNPNDNLKNLFRDILVQQAGMVSPTVLIHKKYTDEISYLVDGIDQLPALHTEIDKRLFWSRPVFLGVFDGTGDSIHTPDTATTNIVKAHRNAVPQSYAEEGKTFLHLDGPGNANTRPSSQGKSASIIPDPLVRLVEVVGGEEAMQANAARFTETLLSWGDGFHPNIPLHTVLLGWSRGGATTHKVAHRIDEINDARGKKGQRAITCAIATHDPCGGPTNDQQNAAVLEVDPQYSDLSNVHCLTDYSAIYANDEIQAILPPIIPKLPDDCKAYIEIAGGVHSSASRAETVGKDPQGITQAGMDLFFDLASKEGIVCSEKDVKIRKKAFKQDRHTTEPYKPSSRVQKIARIQTWPQTDLAKFSERTPQVAGNLRKQLGFNEIYFKTRGQEILFSEEYPNLYRCLTNVGHFDINEAAVEMKKLGEEVPALLKHILDKKREQSIPYYPLTFLLDRIDLNHKLKEAIRDIANHCITVEPLNLLKAVIVEILKKEVDIDAVQEMITQGQKGFKDPFLCPHLDKFTELSNLICTLKEKDLLLVSERASSVSRLDTYSKSRTPSPLSDSSGELSVKSYQSSTRSSLVSSLDASSKTRTSSPSSDSNSGESSVEICQNSTRSSPVSMSYTSSDSYGDTPSRTPSPVRPRSEGNPQSPTKGSSVSKKTRNSRVFSGGLLGVAAIVVTVVAIGIASGGIGLIAAACLFVGAGACVALSAAISKQSADKSVQKDITISRPEVVERSSYAASSKDIEISQPVMVERKSLSTPMARTASSTLLAAAAVNQEGSSARRSRILASDSPLNSRHPILPSGQIPSSERDTSIRAYCFGQ